MATKYNPYSSIKSIYDLKKQWEDATKAGNTAAANAAAQNAQRYYQELRNNDYANVADQLSKVDYAGAKSIHDEYATAGKTAIRPYFETLAKANNMSSDEVNKLIKYDSNTGRVSFAGTDIGKPDAAVDGTSYWEKDYLKGVWDSYINDSKANDHNGVQGNAIYTDRMDSASNKLDQQWNELGEHNNYMTDEYKALVERSKIPFTESEELKTSLKYILPNYIVSGNKSAYGAVASGASGNSGNVDTFAAANAVRQRNAQVAQGTQMAYQLGLDAYQGRIDNINKALQNMGVHRESLTNQQNANISNDMAMAQQAFDNGETQKLNTHNMTEEKKNNQVAREDAYSNITGEQSPRVQYRGILFDDEGNFLPNLDNVNVQALIDDVDERLKTATTSEEKSKLQETRDMLLTARAYKVYNDMGKWGQYASTLEMPTSMPTAAYDLAAKEIDANYLASLSEHAAEQQKAQTEAQLKREEMQNKYDIEKLKVDKKADEVTYAEVPVISGTIDGSSTDAQERAHRIDGYSGINNLSARFINEVLLGNGGYAFDYNGQTVVSEDKLLEAINDKSDAYGLTLEDAEAICELLGFRTAKKYLKQREASQNYEGQPGVASTK